MGKKSTNIISVFGQIEGVVADAMVQEHGIFRIEPKDIPPSVRWDGQGQLAHCALVLTPEREREFDQRVAALRA